MGNGNGTFQTAVNYPAGIAPTSVINTCTTIPDPKDTVVLAVANSGSNTISILIDNGDGTFQPAVDYGVGTGMNPMSLTGFADFNGDGNCDLAVANAAGGTNNNGNIAILLGNGDGTYQPAINYDTLGSEPISITQGNYNGDSFLDLAVANLASNSVTIFLGDGKGGFAGSGDFQVEGTGPSSVSNFYNFFGPIALMTTNSGSNNVTLLYYDSGSIYHTTTFATGNVPAATALGVFAQKNQNLALAVANEGDNTVSVYPETRFRVSKPITFATCMSPKAVVATNLTRPFIEDLVLACSDGVGVMLNTGP